MSTRSTTKREDGRRSSARCQGISSARPCRTNLPKSDRLQPTYLAGYLRDLQNAGLVFRRDDRTKLRLYRTAILKGSDVVQVVVLDGSVGGLVLLPTGEFVMPPKIMKFREIPDVDHEGRTVRIRYFEDRIHSREIPDVPVEPPGSKSMEAG